MEEVLRMINDNSLIEPLSPTEILYSEIVQINISINIHININKKEDTHTHKITVLSDHKKL